MTLDRVETNTTYQHERYGRVLVTGIGEMYKEWDRDGGRHTPSTRNVRVFFHELTDDYSGMGAVPISQDVNEFCKCASLRSAVSEY